MANKKDNTTTANKKDNTATLSIIWASCLLGMMTLIGTAWGKLGLRSAFIILGAIGIIYAFSLSDRY